MNARVAAACVLGLITLGFSACEAGDGTEDPEGISGSSNSDESGFRSGNAGRSGGDRSGATGTTGRVSGRSGGSGRTGSSASTGRTGRSGGSARSGGTGTTGSSGDPDDSGHSGGSASSGSTGESGTSGHSGTSGNSGTTGQSGLSGRSGNSGTAGQSGLSGRSGNSGTTGQSGLSGRSGNSGTTGQSGNSGRSGSSGVSGSAGSSGGPSVPPISGGCNGFATRYWDCCKTHCGWDGNVPDQMKPLSSCNQSNVSLGSNYSEQSSCSGGNAYQCYSLTPWSVSSKLSYGYAAVPAKGDICGRCYQLQFTGASHNAGADEGAKALSGKTMIVQAVNTGHDVAGGQFDLLVPGGGVGAFNACSKQWGTNDLGEQYGGLLAACKKELGYDAGHAAYKSCLSQKCSKLFSSGGTSDLAAGCKWYADWFEAADNPVLVYKEVACPSEITSRSGMNRTPLNDIQSGCGR